MVISVRPNRCPLSPVGRYHFFSSWVYSDRRDPLMHLWRSKIKNSLRWCSSNCLARKDHIFLWKFHKHNTVHTVGTQSEWMHSTKCAKSTYWNNFGMNFKKTPFSLMHSRILFAISAIESIQTGYFSWYSISLIFSIAMCAASDCASAWVLNSLG